MKMDSADNPVDATAQMESILPVKALMEEMRSGISTYLDIADAILGQSGVQLKPAAEDTFSLEKNFFSMLFLYSFHRAGIPKTRRILYASILQCLRGMVTGCDNLLDDEYKKTLDTNIPETGTRFRSVMDIMVSDRVLFQILMNACHREEVTMEQVQAASAASMKTMTRSGVQEATEEAGISTILKPDDILEKVHHYKTGILFQCPWDIPQVIESLDDADTAPLLTGLYQVGLGCQVMDDMVDMMSDLKQKRHNFLVSLIYYGASLSEKRQLARLVSDSDRPQSAVDLSIDFPDAVCQAADISRQFLEKGLNQLLSDSHRFLVEPFIWFLQKRIGVAHLIPAPKQ
jgi:hypothetical protein